MKPSTRLTRLADQAEPLLPKEHAGPGRGHRGHGRKHQGGNSRAYLLARLARDRPDLLAPLQTGELRSVREAARLAGWVCPPGLRLQQTGLSEWRVSQGTQTLGYIRQNKAARWVVWARTDPGEGFAPVAHCQRFEEAQAWFEKAPGDARQP